MRRRILRYSSKSEFSRKVSFFADVTLHCSIGRAVIGGRSKGCQFVLRSTILASSARSTCLVVRLLRSTDNDDCMQCAVMVDRCISRSVATDSRIFLDNPSRMIDPWHMWRISNLGSGQVKLARASLFSADAWANSITPRSRRYHLSTLPWAHAARTVACDGEVRAGLRARTDRGRSWIVIPRGR
jgi:hypothetical protein